MTLRQRVLRLVKVGNKKLESWFPSYANYRHNRELLRREQEEEDYIMSIADTCDELDAKPEKAEQIYITAARITDLRIMTGSDRTDAVDRVNPPGWCWGRVHPGSPHHR